MPAWSVTPVASPDGNTTALAADWPDAHAGWPDTTVSTCPDAPIGRRPAAPARPPLIRSPCAVIGLANPLALFAHVGTPPAIVSTWLAAPAGSRAVTLLPLR